jgi:Ca2+-transporting ATPase
VGLSLLQGASVLAIVLAVYVVGRYYLPGHAGDELEVRENCARGLTFAALVAANLGLILTNRSWSRTIVSMFKEPNKALWWVVAGAAAFLALALYVPHLRDLFHFSTLHATDLVLCLIAGLASVLWFEAVKVLRKRPGVFDPARC